jgi:multiple antibiotic resistance protein
MTFDILPFLAATVHQFSVSELLKTFIALFAIINPPAILPAYMGLTQGMPEDSLKKITRLSSRAVFIVLAVSALLGEIILKAFGISISSFQIGGGLLLGVIAYGMMFANDQQHTPRSEEEAEAKLKGESIAIVPLTIPLLTGPGSMSLCIITASKYHSLAGYIYILVSALAIAIITKYTLRSATKIKEFMGATGMNIMVKVMSLFLMALAIELIVGGVISVFPALAR